MIDSSQLCAEFRIGRSHRTDLLAFSDRFVNSPRSDVTVELRNFLTSGNSKDTLLILLVRESSGVVAIELIVTDRDLLPELLLVSLRGLSEPLWFEPGEEFRLKTSSATGT